jgi:hypothetical protein
VETLMDQSLELADRDAMVAINDDAEPCPGFAVVEAKGFDESTGLLKIGKPSAAGSTAVFFNGPSPIGPGDKGQIRHTFPTIAAYQPDNDDGADPEHGETWGTQADSWYLHRDEAGFKVIGDGVYGACNVILDTPAGADSGFWARLTDVVYTGGQWEYSWNRVEHLSVGGAAVDIDGEAGYCRTTLVVETTQAGTAGTVEIQTARVHGPPLTSGTWSLGGATGLAFDINAGALETALEAALSLSLTVTGSMSAGFTITWVANGDRSLLTGSVSDLVPAGPNEPAYEQCGFEIPLGRIVRLFRGNAADWRFRDLPFCTDSGTMAQTVVTDVTWDEETCEMVKTTMTLGELLQGC